MRRDGMSSGGSRKFHRLSSRRQRRAFVARIDSPFSVEHALLSVVPSLTMSGRTRVAETDFRPFARPTCGGFETNQWRLIVNPIKFGRCLSIENQPRVTIGAASQFGFVSLPAKMVRIPS